MSHRREHTAASLQRIIGQILSEGLNDPRVRGLISVTEVEIAQDGRRATVRVSVLPEESGALSVHGLSAAAGHIRTQVGQRLRVRTVPILRFELDETLKTQARVLDAIRTAVAKSGPAGNSEIPNDLNAPTPDPNKDVTP